jgi:general secretion pathway protein F
MPLVPALSALTEQLQRNPLAEIVSRLADDVNAGSTLADAMGRYQNVFSNLFVSMVAAGEESGTLEEVLLRLAEILDRRAHLANKVKSAIAYPLMMIVVAVAVVVFLLSFVVPSITQIFIEMNRTLPYATRMLISTSNFIRTYLVLIVIMCCAVFLGIKLWLKTRDGRVKWDKLKLRTPFFGGLFLKLEIARLARAMGTLLVSGIPILSALKIAKKMVHNSFIAEALDSVRDSVRRGDSIAGAIKRTALFPPIVFHVIATGQISGDIENGFINIADMYDDEIEMTTRMLVSLLEPAILLVMGVIVGFIVLAILLPIFEISQAL